MHRIAIDMAAVVSMFSTANASTLIFVDQPGCGIAAHFRSEVAANYLTRGISLKRVNISQAWPKEFSKIVPPRSTPTFILVENGKERGIIGYSTKRAFWRNLERVVQNQ